MTMISTRVRVNSYTNVHVVAELSDGELYVVKTYVQASGGCSAPTAKNAQEPKASMGQMRFRQFARFAGSADGRQEALIMIRHPNNSGLQRDQLSRFIFRSGSCAICASSRAISWCWRWRAAFPSRKIATSGSHIRRTARRHSAPKRSTPMVTC